jgi:hypothetical protein
MVTREHVFTYTRTRITNRREVVSDLARNEKFGLKLPAIFWGEEMKAHLVVVKKGLVNVLPLLKTVHDFVIGAAK